jgi:hypothetical protein
MRVEVVRRGGIGGYRLRGSFDTSDLGAEAAATVEKAVRELPFGRPAPPPPRRSELMHYSLTVADVDGQPRTVDVDEDELPHELRCVVEPALHLEHRAGPNWDAGAKG